MGTDVKDQAEVQTRLWREIEKHQIGMLGVVGGQPHHFQPMTAFLDKDSGELWFFTYKDTDLAEAAAAGDAQAMFVFTREREIYACVGGALRIAHDRERMDRYWNAAVAAWYPEGKDDPKLTMLCLDARDAEVWLTETGPIRYAMAVAKANTTHTTPVVGSHTSLNLH
jgi:general stress protein 26